MLPGDTIVVPAKIIGGSLLWKNLVETAQVFSSIALAGAIAASQL
jgi:ribosomal protein L18E